MATAGKVSMAHHAPEARPAGDLKDAGRWPLGKDGRADGGAEDLDEEEGAQALAV